MMKKYFYLVGNEKKGPVSLEQLSSLELKSSNLIFCEGFEDWTKAEDLPELKPFLEREVVLPPTPQEKRQKIAQIKRKESGTRVGKVLIISLILGFVYFVVLFFLLGGTKSDSQILDFYKGGNYLVLGTASQIRADITSLAAFIAIILVVITFFLSFSLSKSEQD